MAGVHAPKQEIARKNRKLRPPRAATWSALRDAETRTGDQRPARSKRGTSMSDDDPLRELKKLAEIERRLHGRNGTILPIVKAPPAPQQVVNRPPGAAVDPSKYDFDPQTGEYHRVVYRGREGQLADTAGLGRPPPGPLGARQDGLVHRRHGRRFRCLSFGVRERRPALGGTRRNRGIFQLLDFLGLRDRLVRGLDPHGEGSSAPASARAVAGPERGAAPAI